MPRSPPLPAQTRRQVPIYGVVLGGQSQALATADDPAHAIHRRALLPQLAAKRIRAFEPFIAETADRLWNANWADGQHRMDGRDGESAADDDRRTIIGVPDEDIDKLMRWQYAATQVVEGLVDQDSAGPPRASP